MKMFLQLGTAILLIGGAVQLTLIVPEEKNKSVEELKTTLNTYSVIEKNFKEYTSLVAEAAELDKPDIVEPEIDKHLDSYNDDYLGSIEIPVLGSSDAIYKSEGDYYLEHNYKKEYNEVGELYLDDRTGTSITSNGALINGHAVPDGRKFGGFKKLLDEAEQPEIIVWDANNKRTETYKMLFISLIDGDNSGIIMNFNSEEQRIRYYKNLYATSIKKWEEPTLGDSFLLLNSCAYIIQSGRYVVIAKKEE